MVRIYVQGKRIVGGLRTEEAGEHPIHLTAKL
jgi:hypothetical protein